MGCPRCRISVWRTKSSGGPTTPPPSLLEWLIEQESALLTSLLQRVQLRNNQREEINWAECGEERDRASMLSLGMPPTPSFLVCHQPRSSPNPIVEGVLWRFHYDGKIDQIIGHWWLSSTSWLLITWLITLASGPHAEAIWVATYSHLSSINSGVIGKGSL